MAKLEGVKTLDMVNGEITKIEYNGEVYERVDTPQKGDIGWIGGFGVYTEILEIDDEGDPVVADEYGGNWYASNLTYFRKPSAPSLKAGDKVRLISNNPKYGFGLARVGDVGEVRRVTGEDVVVDFPNHTRWNGIMAELEIVEEVTEEEAQPTKELFAKVNRPNNVPIPGDYVTFKLHEDMFYVTEGKKYKVVDVDGGLKFKDDDGDFISIVIEGIRTIDEIFVKYTQEQAEQKAKKGDKILVVNDDGDSLNKYENGDILTVVAVDSEGFVYFDDGFEVISSREFIVLTPEQAGADIPNSEEPPKISVGDFVVAEDNDRYKLTIPEAGALEVVEVGEFILDGDIRVKFHRDFIDGKGINAYVGEEYPVNSEYFRLATKDEIAETLGIDSVEVGDKVEVLADDHFYYDKGDTFVVASKDVDGVYDGMNAYILAFDYETDKPRFKVVGKASDKATIKSGDYVINGMGSLGRVDRIEGEWFYGEWLYNEEHPGSFPIGMATDIAIKRLATPEEVAKYEAYKAGKEAKKYTQEIEVGDLVRVIDSPGALPEGSVFKVTEVDEYGAIRGRRENSDEYDYHYAPHHVELVAKAEDVYV